MDQEERLEQRRRQFLKNLHDAVNLLLKDPDAMYVLCARVRDGESQKLLMGMLTNITFNDPTGKTVPATPGMLMDIILEAMMEGPEQDGQTQIQIPKNSYKM